MLSKRVVLPIGFALITLTFLISNAAEKKDKKIDPAKLPPAAKKQNVSYETDIKPLFEKSCVKCHSGEKPKSKYRIDTLESAIKGGESGEPAIIPGKSADSPLVHYISDLVEDMEMPPTEKRDKYAA